jgi:hypothetical protein
MIVGGPQGDRLWGGPADDVIDGGRGADSAYGDAHVHGDVCIRVVHADGCEIRR